MRFFLPLLCALSAGLALAAPGTNGIDEFHVANPMGLHQFAFNYYLERRKENSVESMDADSPLMQRAKAQAVRRLVTQADEDLVLHSSRVFASGEVIEGNTDRTNRLLKLPSPLDPKDGILTQVINAQSSKELMIESGLATANALVFNENVGQGALAGAGAVLSGSQGEWMKLAENKLKRDASLSHHGLLWELGTEFAEQQQMKQGGLNLTEEATLLAKMQSWFVEQGGKLSFVDPHVSQTGFAMHALEELDEGEILVKAPFRLIMCRQTARNVLIGRTGRYLGEELSKTFERNEVWGLAIFLLHEYYKEMSGNGSKWGPFLRTLRMRFLSTEVVQALRGTVASSLSNDWIKSSDEFMWWSISIDGPCSPTLKICNTKPLDKHGGDDRFNIHQIRWAYWVVKQNAVRIRQVSTGLDFLALVPFFGMFDKTLSDVYKVLDKGPTILTNHSGVRFELDGTVTIRASDNFKSTESVKIVPGIFTDSEFFLRFMELPFRPSANNFITLKLPGTIPKGSKFHYCIKGTEKERRSDSCTGTFRSESMFWKSRVLTEWRKMMNLPPRSQELRIWASRLHLYGTGEEEKLQSVANHIIAGLPIPVDEMPAEEQLMLMGVADSADDAAALILSGSTKAGIPAAAPQLYSAPDATDDPEAQRVMEELAYLAAQAQNVISSGNVLLNATQAVLNRTRDFFQYGLLPTGGLDELDDFLLKKIGMLAHCGFENDMKLTKGNVSKELLCAMRVHLMNETEIEVFCPSHVRAWQENCHDVEFLNFTAISVENEALVIKAFRSSISGLMSSYPSTMEDDDALLRAESEANQQRRVGSVMRGAIQLRYNERSILLSVLSFLNEHEDACRNGSVSFQLEDKLREREESNGRIAAHAAFQDQIRTAAALSAPLAVMSVDFGQNRKENLTLEQGRDLNEVVKLFCEQHKLPASNIGLLEKELRDRIPPAPPLILTLGVILPNGQRRVLAITQGSNSSLETGVFCARNNITSLSACKHLEKRVNSRIESLLFPRTVLLVVPIDAPDSRKLSFIIRQGEQHDLHQLASDFLEVYHMPLSNSDMIAGEANKRLPAQALGVPVNLPGRRQTNVRFSAKDNITTVVEGFLNYFELDEDTTLRVAILKRARYGLAPGSYLV